MSLETRLAKLEKQLPPADDLCRCPYLDYRESIAADDAGPHTDTTCRRCGKALAIPTLVEWQTHHAEPSFARRYPWVATRRAATYQN